MYFEQMPMIDNEQVKDALDIAYRQIIRNIPAFTHKFPNAYSENGFYKPIENNYWTTGFWTGEIWLAWEYTADPRLKAAGEVQIDSFLQRIEKKINVDHHDMGFLYSPSCVAGYKLIGSRKGRTAAIAAANQLMSRFRPVGGFLQAWGGMDSLADYRLIIDCLLNVPLLYWAAGETGDDRYRQVAQTHVHTALANVVRSDGSTWHTFYFDSRTGHPDHGATCQGYQDGSAWARGQAWAIYGTALAYRYTREPSYRHVFDFVTSYYLQHLPKDMVPFWDLMFTDGDNQPRDSSSASIAACGLLEMARCVEDASIQQQYIKLARQMIRVLYDMYAVRNAYFSNGLVLHGTYSNRSPYNTCDHCGVDECNIWGDYFYLEALTRLAGPWEPYW